jgi:MFS family permease
VVNSFRRTCRCKVLFIHLITHLLMPSSFVQTKAVIALMIARIFYTVNWFNIPSIFYFIAIDFNEDVSALGLTTATFFIGVGLFQILAGIFAAKYSPRRIAILGIVIASTAALLSAFSTDLIYIAVLRFVVGLGMAFFFGPSVILISKYLGKKSEGLGMGLLNSAHALGGILGLFVWVLLAEVVGWRSSIVLSAVAGLITALVLRVWLPRQQPSPSVDQELNEQFKGSRIDADFVQEGPSFEIKYEHIKKTVFNKSLVILGLTLLGFQIGSGLIWSFIVFYLADYIKINPTVAGFIGSLNLMIALIASPIIGRIYDRIGSARKLLAISGMLSAISIMMIGILQTYIYLIAIPVVIAGFFQSWGFVIVYVKAKQVNTHSPESYQTLSVSYVNGISLFGTFWVPILFAYVITQFGYLIAWIAGGIIFLAFIIPILKLEDNS